MLLDVELVLNNRPLSYVEEDHQMPILIPNNLMFGQPELIPEEDAQNIDDPTLRKRAKYVENWKNTLATRFCEVCETVII